LYGQAASKEIFNLFGNRKFELMLTGNQALEKQKSVAERVWKVAQ
jgi:hypothetical protein